MDQEGYVYTYHHMDQEGWLCVTSSHGSGRLAMCTPDFITWIRKAGYVYILTSSHGSGRLAMCTPDLTSSHGSGRLAMCTPDFITWIRKAGYVYT